jgi:putative MATE family efflux protein
MKDLTQQPIGRNIVAMAVPIAAGMVFQTLYLLVDLYFVARLGDAAMAGVGAAATLVFVIIALTQVLGAGSVALISHAIGRGDHAHANVVFNQSLLLAFVSGATTLAAGYALTDLYVSLIAADAATRDAGATYLDWFWPGLAFSFVQVAIASALRGTGIVKPTMAIQGFGVLLNAVLAPVLIAGWGTGYALGVAGAGLASTLSVAVGVVLLFAYIFRIGKYLTIQRTLFRPELSVWKGMLSVGLPAGGELALMFIYMAVVYWAIADFGPAAQAAFGIGSRITQSILLPALAIAFAVTPIVGQNFGARKADRVRETFVTALLLNAALAVALTVVLQWQAAAVMALFSPDGEVQEIGAAFLRLISWTFVAQGIVLTCSGLFQGLGNTRPAVVSSATRLAVFVPLLVWFTAQPGFGLERVWQLAVATVWLQAAVSFLLLRGEFRRRLRDPVTPVHPQAAATLERQG